MNRRIALRALGACIAVGATRLRAHKLQYSLTDMYWRLDSGAFEVMHSLHLDDAMTLLAYLGDPNGDLTPESQAQLLLYTEQHFQLTRNNEPLALDPVGAQIDGDYLWIYQEQNLKTYPEHLTVTCTLMHDLFPAQQNQVNLRVGDAVRTLRFHQALRSVTY